MITDRFPLTGNAAYLTAPGGGVDLIGVAAPNRGASSPIGDHRVLDIDSIDLMFEGPDLMPLFARQGAPLIEVRTRKELFPQLVTDPFARRVHTIGGMDDFRRGAFVRCRAMDIDGKPTLVAESPGPASWTSPMFVFENPMQIADIAWEFAISRLGPANAFRYTVALELWNGAPDALVAQPPVTIANNLDAAAVRALPLPQDTEATALRVNFSATPAREAAIVERHLVQTTDGSLGVPLLQALHLLERRESPLWFHSLHELNVRSKEFALYGAGDGALTTGIARLDFRAALTGLDAVEIEIQPGAFRRFEARLSASIIERAPVTHR